MHRLAAGPGLALWMGLALLMSLPLAARSAAAQELPPHQQPGKVGAALVLAGPVGNYGAVAAYQLHPAIEVQAGFVMQSVKVNDRTGTATATASANVTTPLVRARLWPMERHNLIAEVGAAAMIYDLQADGSDLAGNSIHYKRGATSPLLFAGGGYGLRTDAGFRLAVLMGWMQYLGGAGESTVTTTGAFDAGDRASMKQTFDDSTDRLVEARPYVELSAGWMF